MAFTLDTYSHVVPVLQEAAEKVFDKMLSAKLEDKTIKQSG